MNVAPSYELMLPASRLQSKTLRRDCLSHLHPALIRVYDHARSLIETHEHKETSKTSEKARAAILRKEIRG